MRPPTISSAAVDTESEHEAYGSVEAALELEQLDANLFRSRRLWKPAPQARAVFGGQIIGQSLAAAGFTIDDQDLKVHSLHSYFVRPGDNTTPALYYVRRVRDGVSFATRQVTVNQRGLPIFEALVSFHRQEPSTLSYQDKMPEVPAPDELPTRQANWQTMLDKHREKMPKRVVEILESRIQVPVPLDIRNCEPKLETFQYMDKRRPREPKQSMWVKAVQKLCDRPNVHACVAAYASDHALVGTAALAAPARFDMAASLDHSMWFHAPFRADEWMLYELASSWSGSARAFITGRLFTQGGVLAVTVSQEGLIRFASARKQPAAEQPKAKL